MSFRSLLGDEWELRHENTREGELYREKERAQQELQDTKHRQRLDDYEREQQDYRARAQLEKDKEERREIMWNMREQIENNDAEIEHLKLCAKFGIEEGEL